MQEVGIGVVAFTAVVMTLVLCILAARAWLAPTGSVVVTVNAERRLEAQAGQTLLAALVGHGVLLPSACGGRGTCGQCRVVVREGGGAVLPTELAVLPRAALRAGARLACQLTIRGDLRVEVARELLGVRRIACRVRSSRQVTTLLREVVLEVPPADAFHFDAGAYVQVTCPPYALRFADLDVDPAFRAEWDALDLRRLTAETDTPTTRAYSIASHPGERGIVTLLVRIATPPPGSTPDVPAGIVSSWLFARRAGDAVDIAGPYGDFRVAECDREMILVGGGAGMAPLRSIVFDQLEGRGTTRTMSFWYGARNRRELLYADQFARLAAAHPNFRWHVALSEPRDDDAWDGDRGFIHDVLFERHLAAHPAPEACDYYLCGPPLMLRATLALLDRLGVDRESIRFDDFGV